MEILAKYDDGLIKNPYKPYTRLEVDYKLYASYVQPQYTEWRFKGQIHGKSDTYQEACGCPGYVIWKHWNTYVGSYLLTWYTRHVYYINSTIIG